MAPGKNEFDTPVSGSIDQQRDTEVLQATNLCLWIKFFKHLKGLSKYLFIKVVPFTCIINCINHNNNDHSFFYKNALFLNLSFFSDFKMRYKDIRPIFRSLELVSLNIVLTSNLFFFIHERVNNYSVLKLKFLFIIFFW